MQGKMLTLFPEQNVHGDDDGGQDGGADPGLEHGLRALRHREQGVPLEVQVLAAQGQLGRRQGQAQAALPGAGHQTDRHQGMLPRMLQKKTNKKKKQSLEKKSC